jgi:predicted SAM-dependent methyltransferase
MLAVIEHVKTNEAISVLKDVYRLLKPLGILIITTPISSS